MKFSFAEKNPEIIKTKIMNALASENFGNIVSVDIQGKQLAVVISKLGTSTLLFNQLDNEDGIAYQLQSEKIAFTHRAFTDDVKRKICSVVKSTGGKVFDV